MASTISKEAINEFKSLLSNFTTDKQESRQEISNLSFDQTKKYLYDNMTESYHKKLLDFMNIS